MRKGGGMGSLREGEYGKTEEWGRQRYGNTDEGEGRDMGKRRKGGEG